MNKHRVKLLKTLVEIPSPSGYEGRIVNFIKKYLSNYVSSKNMEVDFHNNLVVTIKGEESTKRIIIDAHADTIGFLVNNIDKEGYISLIPLGGIDKTIIRGRNILILTDTFDIEGVIGLKPIHLIDDEETEIPNKIVGVTADIGVRKRKHVKRFIKIGDPVVFEPSFRKLLENYVTGYGFDDKAGCFVLIETIKEIVQNKLIPPYDLYFTFSAQEEIGCKGAKELVCRIRPNLFVGVDVTFATDVEEVSERETGRCELGKGIVIYRGVNIDRQCTKLMLSLARENKIKVQFQATNSVGYNADEVAHKVGGIRVVNLAIPLRNMHSPVEIINLRDLEFGIKLLKLFLTSKKLKDIL